MIIIQNIDDNEYFKCSLVRYLHPADHHLTRIIKVNRLFGGKLNFEHIKFPVKIKDIHKIEKKNSIIISVFGCGNKVKYPICVKKCFVEKDVDLILIGEEGKTHYVLIKDLITFMYDHRLHRVRKYSCRYCLQL